MDHLAKEHDLQTNNHGSLISGPNCHTLTIGSKREHHQLPLIMVGQLHRLRKIISGFGILCFGLEGFRIKGPISKIMRWFSFFECNSFHRNQLHALKFIIDYHFRSHEHLPASDHDISLPVAHTDPRQELAELKRNMGGLRLASKIITPANLWGLDCLVHVCTPMWELTSKRSSCRTEEHRANAVLTANDYKNQLIRDRNGAWKHDLLLIVNNCIHNRHCFQTLQLYSDQHPNSLERVDHMVDLMFHIISNRAISMVMHEVEPPFRYATLLSDVPSEVEAALATIQLDWQTLLDAEAAMAIHPEASRAVPLMVWRLCLPVRAIMLALEVCEYKLDTELGTQA